MIAEADIGLTRRSRLRAKLLVFKNRRCLWRFWSECLGKEPLGRSCAGAVNMIARQRTSFTRRGPERSYMECDPRYFCVIGLVRGFLSMEIISHEAAHAGFCYSRRCGGSLWKGANDFDEEHIAYPAGRIAAAINRFLHKKGLYE